MLYTAHFVFLAQNLVTHTQRPLVDGESQTFLCFTMEY